MKFVDKFGNENIEDSSVSEQSSTNESDSNEVVSSQEGKTQQQETSQKETVLEQQTTQPAQEDELEEKDTMPIPLEGGQLQQEPKEMKPVIMLPCKSKKKKRLAPKEKKTEKQVEKPKKRTVHSEKKDTTQSPSSLDSIPFQSIDSGVGSLASRPSLTSGPDDSFLKNFGLPDISQKPKEANPKNRKRKHQRAKSDENLLDDTPETSHSFNDTISFSGNIGRRSRSSSPRRRKRNKKKSPSEIDLQKTEKKTLEEDWEPSSCTQVEDDTNHKSIFVLPTQGLHKGEIVYYRPLSSSSSDEIATTSYFYFH